MHVCTHKIILNSTTGHKRYTLPRTFYWARNGQTSLCRRLTACLGEKKEIPCIHFFLKSVKYLHSCLFFNWGQTRMLQFCCFKNFNLNFFMSKIILHAYIHLLNGAQNSFSPKKIFHNICHDT